MFSLFYLLGEQVQSPIGVLTVTLEYVESAPLTVDGPLVAGVEESAENWIDAAGGPWQYLLIFLLAATPLLEILVVIPIGVGLGLEPVLVALFAFAGNVLPIYGIVIGYERLAAWLESRGGKAKSNAGSDVDIKADADVNAGSDVNTNSDADADADTDSGPNTDEARDTGTDAKEETNAETETGESKRRARARRIWDRYGLPGLALAAPIVTGVHLGALIALGFGSKKRGTILWMTVSIGLWTVAITVVSVVGFEALARVWS